MEPRRMENSETKTDDCKSKEKSAELYGVFVDFNGALRIHREIPRDAA